MVISVGKFFLQPGTEDYFVKSPRLAQVLADSRAEKDCLAYDFYQSVKSPNEIYYVMEFADQAALDAHLSAEHYLDFKTAFLDPIRLKPSEGGPVRRL